MHGAWGPSDFAPWVLWRDTPLTVQGGCGKTKTQSPFMNRVTQSQKRRRHSRHWVNAKLNGAEAACKFAAERDCGVSIWYKTDLEGKADLTIGSRTKQRGQSGVQEAGYRVHQNLPSLHSPSVAGWPLTTGSGVWAGKGYNFHMKQTIGTKPSKKLAWVIILKLTISPKNFLTQAPCTIRESYPIWNWGQITKSLTLSFESWRSAFKHEKFYWKRLISFCHVF